MTVKDECKICGLKGKEKDKFHKLIHQITEWDKIIKEL